MKKLFVLVSLLFAIAGTGFSLSETLISIGYENANDWEFSTDSGNDTYSFMNSSGVNLSVSRYWNGYNIGLFLSQSFLFPAFSDVYNLKEDITPRGLDDYDIKFKYGVVIGPSFRLAVNDNFFLNLGAGFSFSYLFENAGSYYGGYDETKQYFFGLGINVNFNYEISEIMYAGIGSIFNLNFSKYTLFGYSPDDVYIAAFAEDWLGLSFKPYLYIGFYFHNNNVGMGKPK